MATLVHSPVLPRPLRIVSSPDMPSISKVSDHPYTWAEVRDIIARNDLNLFARSEEATEKYHDFKKHLKDHGITVFRHILANTIQWVREEDVKGLRDDEIAVAASGKPIFTEASDLKIVRNDFPYYFEDDVVHLCVWSKTRIESDNSPMGDLTPRARATIEKYVQRTFVEKLGLSRDNLVWFRNWSALQSVKEISHVHVVVKGITEAQLGEILWGPGVPLDE